MSYQRLESVQRRKLCMSNVCMATAQLELQKRMDDEEVSVVEEERRKKRTNES